MSYNSDTNGSQVAADNASAIAGKTVLITGVSPGGLGAFFAETIAKHLPAVIILAGRDVGKVQKTVAAVRGVAGEGVKLKALTLDLASLANVREAAEQVNSWTEVDHIDVLVNNAGVMARPFQLTVDGVESQFAANHLGHFLFTNLIMRKIMQSQAPRVVNISSGGHRYSAIRWYDYNFQNGETYDKWVAYGQSKTANNLFSVALAQKLGTKGLVSTSLHPGVTLTNLGAHLDFVNVDGAGMRNAERQMGTKWGFMENAYSFKTADQAIATHVFTAFSPKVGKEANGKYFVDCAVADQYEGEVFPWATDEIEADRLWKLSEKLVEQDFKM